MYLMCGEGMVVPSAVLSSLSRAGKWEKIKYITVPIYLNIEFVLDSHFTTIPDDTGWHTLIVQEDFITRIALPAESYIDVSSFMKRLFSALIGIYRENTVVPRSTTCRLTNIRTYDLTKLQSCLDPRFPDLQISWLKPCRNALVARNLALNDHWKNIISLTYCHAFSDRRRVLDWQLDLLQS
jgi:hypothetical protein